MIVTRDKQNGRCTFLHHDDDDDIGLVDDAELIPESDDEAVVVEGEELEAEDLGQRHNHALKPYLNLRFLDGMFVCCAWQLRLQETCSSVTVQEALASANETPSVASLSMTPAAMIMKS